MPATAIETLLGLKNIINQAIETVSDEWSTNAVPNNLDDATLPPKTNVLPSHRLYEATKSAIGAAGMLQALLRDPKDHLMEYASQYFEARALHAASLARIPDILHEAALKGNKDGLTASELAEKTGYESHKCARLMRLLATNHIFSQTGPERFSNNRTSVALVHNEGLSNYIDLYGEEWYASSQHLITAFKDQSLDVAKAAFTHDTLYNSGGKDFWAYNDNNKGRHDMFATAMAGSAQSNINALLEDYPWENLGTATVVDVGGGVGTLSLPLLERYSGLKVVIQDRAPVIAQAKEHWNLHLPAAVKSSSVSFEVADFFKKNSVEGAEVYMLRYIMDDWNDDACVKILSAIKDSMNPNSRVLIVEALLIPAWISEAGGVATLSRAPAPLLPNYGVSQRFVHCRDLNMTSLINGTERTAAEMTRVVERSGLKVAKVWACRGAMYITECVLAA